MPVEKFSDEALEILDAGLSLRGVVLSNRQVGDVFGKSALEIAKLGAVNDGLRIHQRRRGDHEALGLDVTGEESTGWLILP